MEIVIVCIGGFHLDGIVKEQIKEVVKDIQTDYI